MVWEVPAGAAGACVGLRVLRVRGAIAIAKTICWRVYGRLSLSAWWARGVRAWMDALVPVAGAHPCRCQRYPLARAGAGSFDDPGHTHIDILFIRINELSIIYVLF